MQTLKHWTIAFVGAIALSASGTAPTTAADVSVQPYYQSAPAPRYVPAPVEEEEYVPPPVVYQHAPPPVVYRAPPPPPVVYYNVAPPVVVAPVYPRRYVYEYDYEPPRYRRHREYTPHVVRDDGDYRRYRRDRRHGRRHWD